MSTAHTHATTADLDARKIQDPEERPEPNPAARLSPELPWSSCHANRDAKRDAAASVPGRGLA